MQILKWLICGHILLSYLGHLLEVNTVPLGLAPHANLLTMCPNSY